MPKTTVVNVRYSDYDIYIGRGIDPKTKIQSGFWGNPYIIGPDGDRDTVIAKYRQYIMSHPDMMAEIPTLKGKRLGCWCAPHQCHGDILAGLANAID